MDTTSAVSPANLHEYWLKVRIRLLFLTRYLPLLTLMRALKTNLFLFGFVDPRQSEGWEAGDILQVGRD